MRHTRLGGSVATVQSIQRAFAILRALSGSPMGVTRLSQSVGLPKSTVARLLAALEEEHAVVQEEIGGHYAIGEGLLDVVGRLSAGRNVLSLARPFLTALVTEIDEIAGISVRKGSNVFYLDHVMPDTQVQVRDWTGEYAPLHLVPSGLVALAHLSTQDFDAYLEGDLVATTSKSVVEPEALRTRVQQVRSVGYAWGFEEFADGINSVAAPIYGRDEQVAALLHVHGPAYRFPDPDKTHDLGIRLIETCRELGERLV